MLERFLEVTTCSPWNPASPTPPSLWVLVFPPYNGNTHLLVGVVGVGVAGGTKGDNTWWEASWAGPRALFQDPYPLSQLFISTGFSLVVGGGETPSAQPSDTTSAGTDQGTQISKPQPTAAP